MNVDVNLEMQRNTGGGGFSALAGPQGQISTGLSNLRSALRSTCWREFKIGENVGASTYSSCLTAKCVCLGYFEIEDKLVHIYPDVNRFVSKHNEKSVSSY